MSLHYNRVISILQKIILYNYRKIFKFSMMKTALASYIIHSINNCRKINISSYFFSLLILRFFVVSLSSYSKGRIRNLLSFSSYSPISFITAIISNFIILGFSSIIEPKLPEGFRPSVGKADKVEDFVRDGPRVAAYIRVSTARQAKEGMSLEVQHDEIEEMKKRYYPSKVFWFTDAGKTGTSFKNRKIRQIQQIAESGFIDELWVSQIDRLGREFRGLIIFCLHLCENGVTIRTPQKVYHLKDLSDMLYLLLKAHGAEEENRRRAERAVASKARNFKLKQWNRHTPLGYKKKNDWIEKNEDWTQIIKHIYHLFLNNNNISLVRLKANKKFGKFLGKIELTRYQIKRFLSDPLYVGKPEYLGEVVIDTSLQFIDEEFYLRAQTILDFLKNKHQPKGDGIKELVEEYGISALGFLEYVEFRHIECGGKWVKNGTRDINGIRRYGYICKKCRYQFWIPKESQLERISMDIPEKMPSINKLESFTSNNDKNHKKLLEKSKKDRKLKRLNSSKLSDFLNYPKETSQY